MRELADLLDPPVTIEQVCHLVRYIKLEPCGWRRSGRRGRPTALYDAATVMEAHTALVPFVSRAGRCRLAVYVAVPVMFPAVLAIAALEFPPRFVLARAETRAPLAATDESHSSHLGLP
jgi:hypothetical protein